MMDESCSTPSQLERELAQLREENDSLRTRMEDAQETLRAIQEGAVDALVIDTPQGQRVFTLQGADYTYRALIEQMQEGAVTLTSDGIIHYCNGRFAEMLKQPLERLMGGLMENLVAPADRAALAAMLREGEGRAELALTAGDSTVVPALVSAILLRDEGPAAICLAFADLTERKRLETEIRELNEELEERVVQRTAQLASARDLYAVTLANIGDGVIVTDAQGRVTFLNHEAERLTGWNSHEAAGHPLPTVFRIVNSKTRQPVENPVEKILRLGTIVGLANHTILIAKHGQETPVDDCGAPIRQGDGTVQGVVLVFRDFSKQMLAEEAINEARAAADRANEAKGRFLANISHELRTPMNAILGMIDLAVPKQVDPAAKDFLQTAKESADLLLTLLDDLLDSSKIEAGKLELDSAPFRLRRMLDQMTRVLGVRASEKGLTFSCRTPAETPDALVGDQVRLRQVLFNLAGNAIKFTERGEVEVSVRAVSQNSEEVRLEFAVRDTGIGISPSDRERLFQPFSQADASTSRRFGGTGLGLSISQSLVAMMGGRLRIESEVGKGSTFSFTVGLPLATEVPAPPEPSAEIAAAAPSTLRILLVEDNPANQKLAAYVLRDRGHSVEIVGDGQQALRMTQDAAYDVILMDVQMPGMDGLEATKAIRARESSGQRVPIIAMTAHTMKGDRERCLAAGMDGYLSKPVDGHEMIALVESLAARGAIPIASANTSATDVFDPDSALRRCFDKRDLLGQIIDSFLRDADNLLRKMRVALQRRDLTEVGRLGHRMKGTVALLGAETARVAAQQVEHYLLDAGDPAEAEEAVAVLERECEVLKSVLIANRTTICPNKPTNGD